MYKQWAIERLNGFGDIIVYENERNSFGFRCKNDYTGLMAQPSRTGANKGRVKRPYQGLFDIEVLTGNRYDTGVTHRNILNDIVRYSSLSNCFEVWRGTPPEELTQNINEIETLYTLALLFFEQEINWGNEDWQRYSYFSPKIRTPKRIRPRDMLMGFVVQAFDLGVENIAYWQRVRPTTTTFIAPDNSNYGFEDYPEEYKRYFTDLQYDNFAEAVMTGDILRLYRDYIRNSEANPYYIP